MRSDCARGIFPVSLIILLLCQAPAAIGQTRFQWPVERLDVGQYQTIDECLAAGIRVRDSATTATPLWRDTLLFSDATMRTSLPDVVVTTTQRCLARFDVETIPINGSHYWLQLYLLAGQFREGRRIVQRRFDAIDSADLLQQIAVTDTFIRMYFDALPIQGDEAAELIPRLQDIEQMSRRPAVQVLRVLNNYFQAAFDKGDSLHARSSAQLVKDLEATISPDERRQGGYRVFDMLRSFPALLYLRRTELIDSLHTGTQGYLSLRRQIWTELTRNFGGELQDRVGKQAVPIEGDFWFRAGPNSDVWRPAQPVQRPARGTVAIMVFLNRDGCARRIKFCYASYAALRRIARQFSEAEVTIAGQTLGYFSESRPLDPEIEAKQLRALWLDYHQLPGVLSVTTTSFVRLPPPDRRRINEVTANVRNYAFGGSPNSEVFQVLIVDPDGVIVLDDDINGVKELEAIEILRAVTNRE